MAVLAAVAALASLELACMEMAAAARELVAAVATLAAQELAEAEELAARMLVGRQRWSAPVAWCRW